MVSGRAAHFVRFPGFGYRAKIGGPACRPYRAKWADPPKVYDRLIYRFNGQGYLKPGFTQIFVVSASGGAPRQLTAGSFPHGAFPFGGGSPVWTPDGHYLVFSASLQEDYEYNYHTQLYELAVADGKIKLLTR